MVTPTPKFEHSALEADIERLAAEIKSHASEKEPNKETVKATLAPHIYSTNDDKSTSVGGGANESKVLPDYLRNAPIETKFKVEKLLDLAWHKGIMSAIKHARKNEPLILDAFHDALTDKLYEELRNRGHIK